jgi:restriction endonuclease Mrr
LDSRASVPDAVDPDELGLSKIYVQAKRYAEATVGRPKIQEEAGTRRCPTPILTSSARR